MVGGPGVGVLVRWLEQAQCGGASDGSSVSPRPETGAVARGSLEQGVASIGSDKVTDTQPGAVLASWQ